MIKNYIKIEANANIENLTALRVAVTTFLSSTGIHIDELMDIKTAVSEAITNAIDHAYDESNNIVLIETQIYDNDKVKIDIVDYGKGIEDISLAMTPTYTTKPETEHAGVGFSIMEAFMDEVIVDSKLNEGTKITLVKNIRKKKSS